MLINGFIDFKVEDIKTYDITSCNQLISLYDMLQFYTKPFLSILDSLTILFSYLHSISLIDHKSTQKLEYPDNFIENINSLIAQLEQIDLQFAVISAKELVTIMSQKSTPFVLTHDDLRLMREIKKRIMDEFDIKKVFILSLPTVNYYDSLNSWQKVINEYPSLTYDIDESGKCLSFTRYTASVFHLMRIIEKGVQLLGDHLEIQNTNTKTWGEIICNINAAINNNKNQGKRQQYNEVTTYLTNIRIAWRNEVMHPKDTYTEEETIGIYSATHIFMTHLVTEIISVDLKS